jgi:hypothetical protein
VPEIVGQGSGAFEDGMKRYMTISQVNKAKTLLLMLTLFAKVGRWYQGNTSFTFILQLEGLLCFPAKHFLLLALYDPNNRILNTLFRQSQLLIPQSTLCPISML